MPTFKPEHAYRVLEHLVESKYSVIPREQWDKSIRLWEAGEAFTLMADGVIVGCGGVMMQVKGKGEAWIMATPLVSRHKKVVFKLLRNVLDTIVKKYDLRRVEATCPSGFPGGVLLLEHLGFVNETPDVMKRYGPGGETFYLFGRTK